MLDLRPRGAEDESEIQLDVLQQMAGEFDVADVGGVVLGVDVVVLQDAGGVEVVHEVLAGVGAAGEVLGHAVDLGDEGAALGVGVADGAEAVPEGDEDDLGLGPLGVDFGDEGEVGGVELARGDVVGRVVVVGAEVDDDHVGGLVGGEVPDLRVVAVDFDRAAGGVACV